MNDFKRNYIMKLRKRLPNLLKYVPEGKKVKIEKDLLDDLIFFKGKTQDGKDIKYPIWTGEFLRKIDLKDLDFKNAIFILPLPYIKAKYKKKKHKFLEELYDTILFEPYCFDGKSAEEFIKQYYHQESIDFSETNINIDFNKLYLKSLDLCDFHGVDLSHSNINAIDRENFDKKSINLRHTNIKPVFSMGKVHVDFSYNDFSDTTIKSYDDDIIQTIWMSNFKSTGLRLEYKYERPAYNPILQKQGFYGKLKYNYNNVCYGKDETFYRNGMDKYHNYITEDEYRLYRAKLAIQKAYIEGRLDGCYLNGKKLNSRQLYDDTICSIDDQVFDLYVGSSNKNSIELDKPKIRF